MSGGAGEGGAATAGGRARSFLYCWVVAKPRGYEVHLLRELKAQNISIFACDGHAIYSNESFALTPDYSVRVVDVDLRAPNGGVWNTSQNAKVFGRIWSRFIGDGIYLQYNWIVKLDSDTVFFPHRLSAMLREYPEQPSGVFINNCRHGLHGPIEIFSRNAVTEGVGAWDRCALNPSVNVSGEEDVFVDKCLSELHIQRISNFHVLRENACDQPDMHCKEPEVVAFHPYKDPQSYFKCWRHTAEVEEKWNDRIREEEEESEAAGKWTPPPEPQSLIKKLQQLKSSQQQKAWAPEDQLFGPASFKIPRELLPRGIKKPSASNLLRRSQPAAREPAGVESSGRQASSGSQASGAGASSARQAQDQAAQSYEDVVERVGIMLEVGLGKGMITAVIPIGPSASRRKCVEVDSPVQCASHAAKVIRRVDSNSDEESEAFDVEVFNSTRVCATRADGQNAWETNLQLGCELRESGGLSSAQCTWSLPFALLAALALWRRIRSAPSSKRVT